MSSELRERIARALFRFGVGADWDDAAISLTWPPNDLTDWIATSYQEADAVLAVLPPAITAEQREALDYAIERLRLDAARAQATGFATIARSSREAVDILRALAAGQPPEAASAITAEQREALESAINRLTESANRADAGGYTEWSARLRRHAETIRALATGPEAEPES